MLLIVLLGVWPLYQAVSLSFTDERLEQPGRGEWVGLENYKELLWSYRVRSDGSIVAGDYHFYRAVYNTIILTVVSVFLEAAAGLAIALVIDSKFKARRLMRLALLAPWVIPAIVSAQMWKWMYNDIFGVINAMLVRLSIIEEPVAWLADRTTALMAVAVMEAWRATPIMALLLLAGLQLIPADLYEAGVIDGAGKLQQFFYLTLPLLRPVILIALIFQAGNTLRIFDTVVVLTNGGSGTEVMATYAYRNLFDFQNLGYGSALNVVLFLIGAIFVIGYVTAFRKAEFDGR